MEAVKVKGNHDWLPEDVYAAVLTNNAWMFVSDEPEGVLVVQKDVNPWNGETALHVWLAHCVDGLELIGDETYALLDQLKTKIGASRITMDGRPGWQKRGWKIKKILFER